MSTRDLFRKSVDVCEYLSRHSIDAALDDVARYHAVIVRVAELDSEVIERTEKLKAVSNMVFYHT